jgi:hypothetical protein
VTGTGEQIIRTALARDLCERADPNHCEDTIGGIERSFGRFSGMQVRRHWPCPDKTPESCQARDEKGSAGAIVVINEPGDYSESRCMSHSGTETSGLREGQVTSTACSPRQVWQWDMHLQALLIPRYGATIGYFCIN